MPLLLETIKIEEGQASNLIYHQKRFDRSRRALFGLSESINLSSLLNAPSKALYRCRIVYDKEIHSVEYIPYHVKEIQKLKVVSADIDYTYKYADREVFNRLLQAHPAYDEIIIEKEGYLTDTTIANIAFYDGKQWFTPEESLLQGTMRAKLLDEGFLQKREIKHTDLKNYTHVALMNAMIGFKILNHIDIT